MINHFIFVQDSTCVRFPVTFSGILLLLRYAVDIEFFNRPVWLNNFLDYVSFLVIFPYGP